MRQSGLLADVMFTDLTNAHTGGAYFRLALEEIQFLDYYGGLARLSVKEYLAADAPGAAA